MSARLANAVTLSILLGASAAGAQAPAPPPAPTGAPTIPAAPPETASPEAPPADPAAPAVPAEPAPGAEFGADAAGAGGELEGMSEAELRELGFGAGEEAAVDTSLRLSGFIDFGMNVPLNDMTKAVTGAEDPAFFIGNLNVYLSKNLTESVRTMVEIRFLYLPNGSTSGIGSTEVVSTNSGDYADFNRPLRWGGIEVERVYVEWAAWRYLTLRGGQFLTPYGVWNVDHGSPTIIPAQKPYIIGVGFFPERQTGLEFYGSWDASNDATVGYHLTLSNGTGPVSEYKDFDRNKAVGARLYLDYRGLGELRFGGSAYYGRNTDATIGLGIDPGGRFFPVKDINTQSDVLALGLDFVWKYRGIHLQGEFVSEQREYTKEGRVSAPNPFTGAAGFPADSLSWGAYGVLGYRFDWLGIMPFIMAQYMDQPGALEIAGAHFGINVRPIDSLAIKAQYDLVNFPGQVFEVRAIYTQVAWAF